MLSREKEILRILLNSETITFDDLMETLSVSRRTLYYDLSKLNRHLEGIGEIVKVDSIYQLAGDRCKIEALLYEAHGDEYDVFLEYDARKERTLSEILLGKRVDRQSLAMEMYVGETTVIQTIKRMKSELLERQISLYYKDGYKLSGNEINIRDLYLTLIIPQREDFTTSERVEQFDRQSELRLTDYSKMVLSSLLIFIRDRIQMGQMVALSKRFEDAEKFVHFKHLSTLTDSELPRAEACYLSAFVSTLPSLKSQVSNPKIVKLVDALLVEIEQRMLINFRDKEECKKNISRHLQSSFHRIKYGFPVLNPLAEEIKARYELLFKLIKNIFHTSEQLRELIGIRDEEIAFIVSYIGAYIERDALEIFEKKRAVVVCPNGITVSKTLQYQLENYFPQLEITGAMSLSEFRQRQIAMDEWVISTVELEACNHLIRVNPILRNYDLARISRTIYQSPYEAEDITVETLVETFKQYGTVQDEAGLTQALYQLYHKNKMQKGGYLMLKDLLVQKHIQMIDKVEDWQSAIRIAARPLLEEAAIEPRYVDAMIAGVEKFGPYIVLTDYFAFAHSRPEDGVKELSMAMLKVNQEFDMLGKPVKIVVVLAATDNTKHLKALSSLTELFMHEENLEYIVETDSVEKILKLVNTYS